jgi:arsenite-transporting ATPase
MTTLPAYLPDPSATTRFLFFTGKGGVGKTSLSCATALRLAEAGRKVLLDSTDPASNLDEVLGLTVGGEPTPVPDVAGLDALNIDPVAAATAYRERMIAPLRGVLPDSALRKMEEELSGSCTVEIAAFDEFSALIGDAKAAENYDHVVFDTAPTGHTLLLLDASEAYQRELERQARSTQPEAVLKLLERLRDPDFTRMLLITLPEATPVHEAAALQDDLRRAGIEPFGWTINQSLLDCGTGDPVLRQREAAEIPYLHEVADHHAKRIAWIPWQAEDPVGREALARLAEYRSPILS